jgi:hypothetical protein
VSLDTIIWSARVRRAHMASTPPLTARQRHQSMKVSICA